MRPPLENAVDGQKKPRDDKAAKKRQRRGQDQVSESSHIVGIDRFPGSSHLLAANVRPIETDNRWR